MSAGLLVIGSGPAGLGAARAYREHGGSGEVLIVTRDENLPYNRPPLSKDFLRGEIEESELALAEPAFYAEQQIEVRLGRTVVAIDTDERIVEIDDGTTLLYDTLVIATGAWPRPLPVPGADGPHVHQLRSLAHARDVVGAAAEADAAVVIGSGFIGCEAAASLRRRGVAVTLVTAEAHPQQARFGDAAARRLTRWLTDDGVALVLGAEITELTQEADGRVTVQLTGHEPVTADIVLVAVGVRPNADFASVSGSPLGLAGGRIVVDAQLRTNRPHVLAAGDVAAAHNITAGRQVPVEHWSDAEEMGEIAGANAAGGTQEWDSVPGFWSEIGERTLKYHSWGGDFDDIRFVAHSGGGFTAWYLADEHVVGVLTHDADDDYERGEKLIADHAPRSGIDA